MIEEMPQEGSAIPNIKKLIDSEFTVPKAYICSVDQCNRRASLTDNDLCSKHELEILEAADKWETDKKAKKYGYEIQHFNETSCLHLNLDGNPFCPDCGISLAEIKQLEYEDRIDRDIDEDKL